MVKSIDIDLRIFPVSAVQYTISAFHQVCGISCQETANSAVCAFDCRNADFEEIRDEFCNYLIYAANKGSRAVC